MKIPSSPTSRRRFLATASVAALATLVLRQRADAADAPLDPRAAALAAQTIGIDTHNHIDVPLAADQAPGPDLDITGEMKASGLSAVCMTFATDYQPGDAYSRFLKGLDAIDRQLERNQLARALSAASIRSAHAKGQPSIIQSVEGGHFLDGHIERLGEAHQRGVRHLGLLHDSDASVPLGDVYTNPPRFGGLTPFGASVIRECNRLGILVDLAHANLQTTQMALKVSTRPVIVSHTGLDTRLGSDPRMAAMMRPRLISREQARLIADSGGLVGVWTHLSATPLEYAQNLRALAEVIGVDHICIGTDTKLIPASRSGQPPRPGERTNQAWPTQTLGFYPAVVDAMLKTGFTPGEIAKIGGENYLRVFTAAVAK